MLFECCEDVVSAHDRAQRVGADSDQILTRRTTAIHRVEGGNGGNLGAGQTQLGTAEIDPGRGDVPVLGLHEMKERQEG